MKLFQNGYFEEDEKVGQGICIHIDPNSPEADKVRSGWKWSITDDGQLIFTSKSEFDIKAFKAKLTTGTATLAELREFILKRIV